LQRLPQRAIRNPFPERSEIDGNAVVHVTGPSSRQRLTEAPKHGAEVRRVGGLVPQHPRAVAISEGPVDRPAGVQADVPRVEIPGDEPTDAGEMTFGVVDNGAGSAEGGQFFTHPFEKRARRGADLEHFAEPPAAPPAHRPTDRVRNLPPREVNGIGFDRLV
jgi:hypothetical protein